VFCIAAQWSTTKSPTVSAVSPLIPIRGFGYVVAIFARHRQGFGRGDARTDVRSPFGFDPASLDPGRALINSFVAPISYWMDTDDRTLVMVMVQWNRLRLIPNVAARSAA
jgi:hypothetical protein